MQKVIFLISILFICFSFASCGMVDDGISPKKLDALYINNKALFIEVKEIIEKKQIELKSDNIFIDDNSEENKTNENRVFVYFTEEEGKKFKNLIDIFNKDEVEKIEEIFKDKFIFIDSYKTSCAFAEQGFLDCHDEILYTSKPKELEEYAANDDDEIVKKLTDNWFIYGVR